MHRGSTPLISTICFSLIKKLCPFKKHNFFIGFFRFGISGASGFVSLIKHQVIGAIIVKIIVRENHNQGARLWLVKSSRSEIIIKSIVKKKYPNPQIKPNCIAIFSDVFSGISWGLFKNTPWIPHSNSPAKKPRTKNGIETLHGIIFLLIAFLSKLGPTKKNKTKYRNNS